MPNKLSDKEIMKILEIDAKILKMFKKVRQAAMKEAKKLSSRRKGKIRVLGISGSARDGMDMAQEDSNSEALLKTALDHCKKLGAETELVQLRKYDIRHCKACYSTVNTQCHFYCSCYPKGTPQGDDMTNKLYDKVLWADAVIFATPVNNFKISSPMSYFIDRCISLDGSLGPANPKSPKDKALNIKHMKFIELTADPKVPGSGMLRRFPGRVAGIIATGHEEGASLAISQLYMTLTHYGMLFPPFSNMYAIASVCHPTYSDKKTVLSECYSLEARMLAENVMKGVKLSRAAKLTEWMHDNRSN